MNFEALRSSTIPGLLVERARTRPTRVALRSKELGIWRETTWREVADRVAVPALGFAREYRLARGETVAISETRARSGRWPMWPRRPSVR